MRAPILRRGVLRTLFSPGSALALCLLGYYSFAGLTNFFIPEGNVGGILVRAGPLAFLLIAFQLAARERTAVPHALPVVIFFFIYLLRLYENAYFSDVHLSPPPEVIFLIFIFSGIVPALCLAILHRGIRDSDFSVAASLLCVVFLLGLALNRDVLLETADSRLQLDKINPISLGHLAAAFLIYYALYFTRSKRLRIEACIIAPLLFLIVIYARSRGAYIAGAAAIAMYVLLVKGSHRVWMVLAGIGGGVLFAYTIGVDHFEIIAHRLEQIDPNTDRSTYLHHLALVRGWEQFLESPLVGRYTIESVTNFYPHNIFLESLMAVGILGSIPLAAHLSFTLTAAIRIIRTPGFPTVATFIAVLVFQQIIASGLAGSVWGSSEFWIVSTLTIAFWYGRPRNRRRPYRRALSRTNFRREFH